MLSAGSCCAGCEGSRRSSLFAAAGAAGVGVFRGQGVSGGDCCGTRLGPSKPRGFAGSSTRPAISEVMAAHAGDHLGELLCDAAGGLGSGALAGGAFELGGALVSGELHGGSTPFSGSAVEILVGAGVADEEPSRTSRLALGVAGVCVEAPSDVVLFMPGPLTVDRNLLNKISVVFSASTHCEAFEAFRSGAAGGVGSEAFDDGALKHGGALVSVERHGGSTLKETHAQVDGGFTGSTRGILVGAGFC